MEMELLGQLNQPTRNPYGDWLPPPPSTVNNMVISSISEGALMDFALFLLVVTMGTCSTPQKHLNCKEFLPGTTPRISKSRGYSVFHVFLFPGFDGGVEV